MSVQEKSKFLIRIEAFPLDLLEDNDDNPNAMSDREFDLLVQNMEETGWTDAAFAAPIDWHPDPDKATAESVLEAMVDGGIKARIVGGHHRVKAGRYLGLTYGPIVLNIDPAFDKTQQDIQLVRHNVIKGRMDPAKFFSLYSKHVSTYGDEMMAETFGFADRAELDRLIEQTKKTLPKELKKKFAEAAEEIKTVDELATILNKLFTMYGNTMKFGYMFVEYAGQRSIWLRASKKTLDACEVVGHMCAEHNRTLDDVLGRVVQLIATGQADTLLEHAVFQTPETKIPPDFKGVPTKDNLEKIAPLSYAES